MYFVIVSPVSCPARSPWNARSNEITADRPVARYSPSGAMTKTNKIGMVGGYPIPEVNRLMHAFMEGAKEVNPNVKFTISFIGSWFDPPKAKEAAFQGDDVREGLTAVVTVTDGEGRYRCSEHGDQTPPPRCWA